LGIAAEAWEAVPDVGHDLLKEVFGLRGGIGVPITQALHARLVLVKELEKEPFSLCVIHKEETEDGIREFKDPRIQE
jgi:hypothetical protein